ncbi:MAG TPA: hypothetical protein VJT73_16540 [Polyangiaceae bacterium]|nr:hypothetical protein [Polyangiaceae bacterium]
MAPAEPLVSANSAGPRVSVLSAALATAAAAAFAPALGGEWIYDDRPLIARNIYDHSFAHWWRWFSHDFWDVSEDVKQFGSRMMYWRPGIHASYAWDWLVGGGSPMWFHLVNTAWHALVAVLAFHLLRRWIGAVAPAFVAALLFALHPTKAESVAWISGRTDVLCMAAVLIASLGVARRLRKQRGGLALEIAGTAFAYMTKEQSIVLAAFVFVETWVALGRPALDAPVLRRLTRAALPQLALAGAYLLLRSQLLPLRPEHHGSLPLSIHAGEVAETMGRYAELLFWPRDLSVQQGLMGYRNGKLDLTTSYIVMGAIFVAILAISAAAARVRWPGVTLGIAFFFFTIFPTSNVMTTDMMTMLSERFLYLPSLGFAFAIGVLLDDFRQTNHSPWPMAAAAFAIATLAVVSFRRSADFEDEKAFWERELLLHPHSIEANRFAVARAAKEKRFAKAIELASRAQKLTVERFAHLRYEYDFIVQGLEFIMTIVPDHDVKTLRAIDVFFEAVADPKATSAELDVGNVSIRVPLDAAARKRCEKRMPTTVSLHAITKSRLGDDAAAVALAEQAHGACTGCVDLARTAVLVMARAGNYRRAHEILDVAAAFAEDSVILDLRTLVSKAERAAKDAASTSEPAMKLTFRAAELSSLEAWGRAYDVLAPSRGEIKNAPGYALGFAELAWRAGEFAVARDVLAAVVPPETIASTTEGWSMKMGWVDPPSSEEPACPRLD